MIKDYGERVRHLHFKDCSPSLRQHCIAGKLDCFDAVKAGVFCELDQGDVDFPVIVAEIENLGYNGWVTVEQDVLTDDIDAPKQSAPRNREYLRSLGL